MLEVMEVHKSILILIEPGEQRFDLPGECYEPMCPQHLLQILNGHLVPPLHIQQLKSRIQCEFLPLCKFALQALYHTFHAHYSPEQPTHQSLGLCAQSLTKLHFHRESLIELPG